MSEPIATLTPGEVAERALARRGVHVAREVADAVAEAVLSTGDSAYEVRHTVDRVVWVSSPHIREHVVRKLRFQIIDALARQCAVPTDLPAESLRFVRFTEVDGRTAVYEVPELSDWQAVQVVLTVPVRRLAVGVR